MAVAVVALSPVGVAQADAPPGAWPAARLDARRQAYSVMGASLTKPGLAWELFLGGTLGDTALLPGGGAAPSVLMVAAGQLEARRADDAPLWRSGGHALTQLVGAFDLDGDGQAEVVALGRDGGGEAGAFVFDRATGALRWRTPPGTLGVVGDSARLVDLDGDGLLDLYVANSSGTDAGATPGAAFTFRFAGGFDEAEQLAQLALDPPRDYWGDFFDALGDFDGDGAVEVFVQGRDEVYLYDPLTGVREVVASDVGKTNAARSRVEVADVDGDGADEAILLATGGWSALYNAVRVAVIGWDAQAGTLALRWERAVAAPAQDKISVADSSLADVDGDGALEVVASFAEGAPEGGTAAWVLEVRDAATGALEASLPGARFRGAVDLDADGAAEVLTRGDDPADPTRIYGMVAGGLALRAELVDEPAGAAIPLAPLSCVEHGAARPTATRRLPCVVTAAGSTALLVAPVDAAGAATGLRALAFTAPAVASEGADVGAATDAADGAEDAPAAPDGDGTAGDAPVVVGAFDAPPGVTLKTVAAGVWGDALGPTAAVVSSTGRLWIFDEGLAPVNFQPDAAQPVLGLRVRSLDPGYGGLPAAPVAADLDGVPGAEVVGRTSDGRVHAWSVAALAPGQAPQELWAGPVVQQVAVVWPASGVPLVVVASGGDVRGLDGATGAEVWSAAVLEGGRSLYGDIVGVDLDGDGGEEVLLQSRGPGGEQRAIALEGESGAVRWEPVIDVNSAGMRRLTAARLEGPEEVAALVGGQIYWVWRLAAADGTPSALGLAGLGAYLMALDVDADGADELVAMNRSTLQELEPDGVADGGVVAWTHETGVVWPLLGAAAPCGDAWGVVTPFAFDGRLRRVDGASGETDWEATLAGGTATLAPPPTEGGGEAPAVEGAGFLSNPAAVAALAPADDGGGAGLGPAVIVGSTDGHLYAVDACDGTLRWALDVRRPLRGPLLADTDGDGAVEVVVGRTDGTLMGVDTAAQDAPGDVWDTDPPSGLTAEDVDDIETVGTLYGAWLAVDGATGYRVSVATVDGLPITASPVEVGLATSAALSGLELVDGVRYVLSVQAQGEGGWSIPRSSDGVTVHVPAGEPGPEPAPEPPPEPTAEPTPEPGAELAPEVGASEGPAEWDAEGATSGSEVALGEGRTADVGAPDLGTGPIPGRVTGCSCRAGGRPRDRGGLGDAAPWLALAALWGLLARRRR